MIAAACPTSGPLLNSRVQILWVRSMHENIPFEDRTYTYLSMINRLEYCTGLATKWLRILSLGGIDKIRNHLVANPIVVSE